MASLEGLLLRVVMETAAATAKRLQFPEQIRARCAL